jgi:HAD superfamily hydrolase (TIGR01549 family)
MAVVRWVFFDLGGVLVDEDALHEEMASVIARLAVEYGVLLSAEEIRARFIETALNTRGMRPSSVIDSLLADRTKAEEVLTRYRREVWPRFPDLMKVRDGALDLLKALSSSYSLALIANQPRSSRRFIDSTGISGLMKFSLLSEEFGASKPDPKIFEEAFRRCLAPGRECVMVGDRVEMDVAPAKRLGMRTVRMRAGLFAPVEPKDDWETADAEIRELRELPGVLGTFRP